MNLILLEPGELCDGEATLEGRRARHVFEVHRAVEGDELAVGILDGPIGSGVVHACSRDEVRLRCAFGRPPPEPPGLDLLLALPRPKILRKVLASAASLGVKRIVLVNAARVEKSYFDSPLARPEAMREEMILGLEQSRDTTLPELRTQPLFRPFVEDEAPVLWADAKKLIAHPAATMPLERCDFGAPPQRAVLAIGPEGGWVPFEVELLAKAGFQPFTLGPRILRVDVAVPALLGQLELCRRALAGRSR